MGKMDAMQRLLESATASVQIAGSPFTDGARMQPGFFGCQRNGTVFQYETGNTGCSVSLGFVEHRVIVPEFQECFEIFYMLSDVDDFIVVVSFYLFFYIRAVGARFHSVYLNHDEGFLIALLAKVGKKSLYGRVFFLNFGEKRRFPCL